MAYPFATSLQLNRVGGQTRFQLCVLVVVATSTAISSESSIELYYRDNRQSIIRKSLVAFEPQLQVGLILSLTYAGQLYLAHHHLTSHPLHLEAAPAQPHAPRHIDLARVGFNPDDDDDDGEDDQGHKLVTVDEVRRHRTKESCWVVLGGEVWE